MKASPDTMYVLRRSIADLNLQTGDITPLVHFFTVCLPVETTVTRAWRSKRNNVNLTFGREPLGFPTMNDFYMFRCASCECAEEMVDVITHDCCV